MTYGTTIGKFSYFSEPAERKLQHWEGFGSSWVSLGASWEGLRASWEGPEASWEGLRARWEGGKKRKTERSCYLVVRGRCPIRTSHQCNALMEQS